MRYLNKNFIIKFFIIDFVFFAVFYATFITTFPINEIFESNKEVIKEKTGKVIKYKKLSLSFGLSINIEGLEVISIPDENDKNKQTSVNRVNPKDKNAKNIENKEPARLFIKTLTISPNIKKMLSSKLADIDFDAELMNGTISGNFTVITEEAKTRTRNRAKVKNKITKKIEKNKVSLALDSINLMTLSKYLELELPYDGKISGELNTIFGTSRGKTVVSQLDMDFDMKTSKLGPGKVKAMGSYLTIDPINLGDFKIKGATPLNSSKFKFEPLNIDSKDLKADLSGTISFGRNIMPNLKLKFKFTKELLKTNKKVKAVMGGISNLKRKDGYYGVKLTGTLERMRQRPWLR